MAFNLFITGLKSQMQPHSNFFFRINIITKFGEDDIISAIQTLTPDLLRTVRKEFKYHVNIIKETYVGFRSFVFRLKFQE